MSTYKRSKIYNYRKPCLTTKYIGKQSVKWSTAEACKISRENQGWYTKPSQRKLTASQSKTSKNIHPKSTSKKKNPQIQSHGLVFVCDWLDCTQRCITSFRKRATCFHSQVNLFDLNFKIYSRWSNHVGKINLTSSQLALCPALDETFNGTLQRLTWYVRQTE